MYGTGIRSDGGAEVMHASASRLSGPWTLHEPVKVEGVEGRCVAAPGAVSEDGMVHLFVQTEFNRPGGRLVHLASADGGRSFGAPTTALFSSPAAGELGIYDPQPVQLREERYLVYAAFTVVGQPEIHVARSRTSSWDGPWERLGAVIRHDDVGYHNQVGTDDYEWGLEAPQLFELPDGRCLLAGVCFLAGKPPGTRQSLFLAVASVPTGPYEVLPSALSAIRGENGHGCVVEEDGQLHVLHQERDGQGDPWRLALARLHITASEGEEPDSDELEDVA